MPPDEPLLERPVRFFCEGETLIGILAQPEQPAAIGVVVVVGGPQYRAGSHRQFTLLARRLASAGFAVLRFDYRGMGDSSGTPRNFEAIDADIRAAIDALVAACPSVRGVVLWGLCDAASAAMMYAPSDARVAGLALANPWARGAESYAQAQLKHYYLQRLLSADFWRKVLRGEFNPFRSAGELRASVRDATASRKTTSDFRVRMLNGLRKFAGPVLLVISGQDLTAQEFLLYVEATRAGDVLSEPMVRRIDLPEADHTFSTPDAQEGVESSTLEWLRSRVTRD
jgi:exosortase A-associated hydrolase 1